MPSFLEFATIISNINTLLIFLRDKNLLSSGKYCEACEVWMVHVKDKYKQDRYIWRCNSCKRKASIRQNSFWQDQSLSLKVYISLLYLFATNIPASIALAMLSPDISINTIHQWYSFFRDIISRYLIDHPVHFNDEIVEIDESKWGKKRKYQRGNPGPNHPWIFGMLGRLSQKVALFIVNRRRAVDLVPRIQAYAHPNCTIHSDDWRAYRRLGQHFQSHNIVVHDQHFVDPVTGAHTNGIEGFWAHAKNPFKNMHGVYQHRLPSHLDERMFRWNNKDQDIFELLMHIISTYYNVEEDRQQFGDPPVIKYSYLPQ
jgi:hypothetical protein